MINGAPSGDYLKKSRVSLIPQKYSNFPWLTAAQNVALATEDVEQVRSILARVGLSKSINLYPSQLSGGMQQRVAIARAFLQKSDIIALDEPFAALDVQTRSQMQEFLSRMLEQEKRTMVLVTHDIDEAIYLADRILVVGGTPAEVREVIKVNLSRPRRPEIRFQEDFLKLKKAISYMIRSESIRVSLGSDSDADPTVLKVGMYLWSGNAPFYLADDAGIFSKHGIEVELVSTDDNNERIKLWREDKLDVLNVTLDNALLLKKEMPDIKIFSVLNSSRGGDALIVHEPISTVQGLKGKRVGLEINSAGHFFLLYLLHKAGLSSADVQIVDMKAGEVGAAIIAASIDGGVLWEPWLSKAKELSNTKILADTEQYPVLYDVLVVKGKVYKDKIGQLRQLYLAWLEALDYIHQNREAAIRIISSCIGISETELSDSLSHIEFLSKPTNAFRGVLKEVETVLRAEKKLVGNWGEDIEILEQSL